MSETANIAEIAAILSEEIFPLFGWERVGPTDHKWDCVEIEKHNKKRAKVHPSDVVFRYRDPYRGLEIYANTDLKSYAAGTVESSDLTETLRNLAIAVECANKSPGWQAAYLPEASNYDVVGLLFIYNHDGEYDKDFGAFLSGVSLSKVKVAAGRKLFVMGPDRISYLNTVAKDILQERGATRLPNSDSCHFYYPDLENAKVSNRKQGAATLEMLLGPWQILRFGRSGQSLPNSGYYFYCATKGESEDEFMYILDFIFTYQLLDDEETICIRMPFASAEAHSFFEKAKNRYADEFWSLAEQSKKDFANRMKRIVLKKLTDIKTVFSTTEIGMKRHG